MIRNFNLLILVFSNTQTIKDFFFEILDFFCEVLFLIKLTYHFVGLLGIEPKSYKLSVVALTIKLKTDV